MRKARYFNYIAEVLCRNCRYWARKKIPIGQAIEDTACPHCGRKELHNLNYYGYSNRGGE